MVTSNGLKLFYFNMTNAISQDKYLTVFLIFRRSLANSNYIFVRWLQVAKKTIGSLIHLKFYSNSSYIPKSTFSIKIGWPGAKSILFLKHFTAKFSLLGSPHAIHVPKVCKKKTHSYSIATMLQRHAQNHTHAFISRATQTYKNPSNGCCTIIFRVNGK